MPSCLTPPRGPWCLFPWARVQLRTVQAPATGLGDERLVSSIERLLPGGQGHDTLWSVLETLGGLPTAAAEGLVLSPSPGLPLLWAAHPPGSRGPAHAGPGQAASPWGQAFMGAAGSPVFHPSVALTESAPSREAAGGRLCRPDGLGVAAVSFGAWEWPWLGGLSCEAQQA